MLWHTIYLGQQLWGALCSFVPHLCHPPDSSQINHKSRLRQYSLILRREMRVGMRYAGGGFGFISPFASEPWQADSQTLNSGSAKSIFLLRNGRHSLFTALTLSLRLPEKCSVFSAGRNQSKDLHHNTCLHSSWSHFLQPTAGSVSGCTCPVESKINIFKEDDQSFVWNCSIFYHR